MRLTPEDLTRFWSKVKKTEDCWLWTGAVQPQGYGSWAVNRGGERLAFLAHRLSYEELVGPIPNGLTIDHLCRVRLCVRPTHLEAVTQRVNVQRGRSPSALLSQANVCKKGHALNEPNTYRRRDGSRECVQCRHEKSMARERRRVVA